MAYRDYRKISIVKSEKNTGVFEQVKCEILLLLRPPAHKEFVEEVEALYEKYSTKDEEEAPAK